MAGETAFDPQIDEYWDWLAVALFLLTTVDMLTTIYAAGLYGAAGEANPVMRWVLGQGIVVIVAVNILAVVTVGVLFYAIADQVRTLPSPIDRYFAIAVEVWIGVLIAIGLAIFANNLSVIVLRESLFSL